MENDKNWILLYSQTHQDKFFSRLQVSVAEWLSLQLSVLLQLNIAT